ncbi:putative UDP-glucuronosyltransferase 2A1-like [Apostichopus japonicus]|uniref:UDP-glucuronosyltransferase n=1 Tax=Stichopus japonicus TaxID=307972 RepID=A0A2G8JN82_STIJA|nr:putative UDP-glucuronosyltransferase 2A1-like [Apostichopus japonicus]
MIWIAFFFFVFVSCSHLSDSSKILMIPYSGEGSHYLSMALVGESLVSNGHNVTFLVSDIFDLRASHPHYYNMFTFQVFPHHLGRDGFFERKKSQDDRLLSGDAVYHAIVAFEDIIKNFSMDCEDSIRDVALRDRLVDAEFDFAVVDPTTPCGVIIAQMLYLPYGLFLPIAAVPNLSRFLSVPATPSYVSSWQSGYSDRMSLPERAVNALMDISWTFFFNVALFSYHDALRPKYDVRNDVNTRLGMADSYFSLSFADLTLEYPKPFTPNVIGSAGLNLAKGKETMSQEWNIFVDTHGQRGMVIVSFGTLLHNIPEHVTIKLVDAFSQLPYTVVWQLSRETHVANLSCNIHRFEWLPLAGLLAQEKTVLFISHAGINSMYEAIYYSKPVLTFPLFGDQPDTARRAADRHMGEHLHLYRVKTHEIVDAIIQITTDSR